jgi:hypothetical protein
MRDVGENFTHILPQEKAYLRLFEEHRAYSETASVGDVLKAEADDHLFRAPPREVQFQTIPVEQDILSYLEYFKNQTLAPDLFKDITVAHSSKMKEEVGKAGTSMDTTLGKAPVAILSFPKNSSHTAYCNDLIKNQNMTLIRFTQYKRDPATGMAVVTQLGTIESHTAWRAKWPHMPEDHEQQVRDMFV